MSKKRKITRRRWTEQEDDAIEKTLNEEALNLREAFEKLAEELDRSPGAVEFRWYGVLNNPEHPKYRGTKCFVTICRKRALINKKILTKNSNIKPVKIKVSWWRSMLDWFKK